MTFILAIQLEDSIIVTTDNRIAVLTEDGQIKNTNDELTKFYLWDKGIITGSGEYIVIQTAVELFKNISGSKIAALPKCLQISRMIRELKVEHFQIATSKLIYSEELEKSFDFIFQSREDYMHGHVPNTDNRPLKFIENFPI